MDAVAAPRRSTRTSTPLEILVSHAHYNHFEDAVPLARKKDVPMYGPAGLNQALLTLGVLPLRPVPRFNKGGSI
jgi:L-ascorbate metabolism protein UlaG (beta-lactamase superfamily)